MEAILATIFFIEIKQTLVAYFNDHPALPSFSFSLVNNA